MGGRAGFEGAKSWEGGGGNGSCEQGAARPSPRAAPRHRHPGDGAARASLPEDGACAGGSGSAGGGFCFRAMAAEGPGAGPRSAAAPQVPAGPAGGDSGRERGGKRPRHWPRDGRAAAGCGAGLVPSPGLGAGRRGGRPRREQFPQRVTRVFQ